MYDNEVDIGGGYVSTDSFRFGRYTGLGDQGGFAIGNFTLRGRDLWNSGGTTYWDIEGHNMGLDSRSFSLAYGNQGLWGVNFYYDGIPYLQSRSFQTVYDASHNGTLNGAPSSAATWYDSGSLAGFLNEQDVRTQRDIFGGKGRYLFGPQWQLSGAIRHEHKDGSIEQTMLFGTGKNAAVQGSTPTSTSGDIVTFRQPIDYDTDQYEINLAYSGHDLQGQLGYVFSQFTDNMLSFNGIDPFLERDRLLRPSGGDRVHGSGRGARAGDGSSVDSRGRGLGRFHGEGLADHAGGGLGDGEGGGRGGHRADGSVLPGAWRGDEYRDLPAGAFFAVRGAGAARVSRYGILERAVPDDRSGRDL